jgi:hypothetical protein
VKKVLDDINSAIESGLINPYEMDSHGMSDLANYIMFGGNGKESQEIINLGEKIITEYSGQEAKDRLEFRKMMRELEANLYEDTETENSNTETEYNEKR